MSLRIYSLILIAAIIIPKSFSEQRQTENESKGHQSTIPGKMVNGCVCEIKGDIYNLTSVGNPNGPVAITFTATAAIYSYLIDICFPFKFPQIARKSTKLGHDKEGDLGEMKETYQPHCLGASLCQRSFGSQTDYYKLVTSQKFKNDEIKCFLNVTTGNVQWVYKCVGPLYEKGGMVLDLICGNSLSKIRGVHDVPRTEGDPWKYVSVTDRCCCKNKCKLAPTIKPFPTHQPSRDEKKENETPVLIYGAFGFLVMVALLLLAVRWYGRLSDKPILFLQNRLRSLNTEYGTFVEDPVLRQRLIKFDEIQNLRIVGEGSFGVVSRGTWRGGEVAVKRIKEEALEDDQNCFLKESLWMCKLANRHIVQFYGICILKPNLCIVTEYMSGGSVADVIHVKKERLGLRRIKEWSIHAAKGMAFLHSNRPSILHRDLKSDNLLVDGYGCVKVCDFGTVKLLRPIMQRQNARHSRHATPIQQANPNDTAFKGTLRWSPPEVIPDPARKNKIKYTTGSDAYSFAITVWEMMYNERPYFMLEWNFHVMIAITSGNTPDVDDDCPEQLNRLFQACWRMKPQERPSFPEILARLEGLVV